MVLAAGMFITSLMMVGVRRKLSTMATPDAVFIEVRVVCSSNVFVWCKKKLNVCQK